MRIFFLLTDEPHYTRQTCEMILNKYKDQVVGAAFPTGVLKWKRIQVTYQIYGLIRFSKLVLDYFLMRLNGGCVAKLFNSSGIPIYYPSNINSRDFVKKLKKENVDVVISINCPQILRSEILEISKLRCLNLHFGALPKYRGIHPIFYAIINGEKNFGVTIHLMDEKIDNGPILEQKVIPIKEYDNLFSLYPKAFSLGGELFSNALQSIESGNLVTKKNDRSQRSYYSYPSKATIEKYKKITKKT